MTEKLNRKVLLLDRTGRPFRIITVRDAIEIMMREDDEGNVPVLAIDGVAAKLNTVDDVYEVPSVLMLSVYHDAPQQSVPFTRRNVFRRDKWQCVYCGRRVGDLDDDGRPLRHSDFTIEHIIPQSRGGKTNWGNVACCCRYCNNRKGNRMPHEAGMSLRFEPKKPRGRVVVVEYPDEWRIYFEE
jgi:5-methylcytosine-specific restriction endonuclease McrA